MAVAMISDGMGLSGLSKQMRHNLAKRCFRHGVGSS
jgi:hypothetical protein